MKITRVVLLLLAISTLYSVLSARRAAATSYIPHTVIEEQQNIYKRSAGIICLFHGANPDVVQKTLGQEFSVFRNRAVKTFLDKTPVGKIRLTDALGAHYLEAMTIEGEVKEGDVVQLQDTYALVVLTNGRCETLKQPEQEPEQ